jgi:hypothetical protein
LSNRQRRRDDSADGDAKKEPELPTTIEDIKGKSEKRMCRNIVSDWRGKYLSQKAGPLLLNRCA